MRRDWDRIATGFEATGIYMQHLSLSQWLPGPRRKPRQKNRQSQNCHQYTRQAEGSLRFLIKLSCRLHNRMTWSKRRLDAQRLFFPGAFYPLIGRRFTMVLLNEALPPMGSVTHTSLITGSTCIK